MTSDAEPAHPVRRRSPHWLLLAAVAVLALTGAGVAYAIWYRPSPRPEIPDVDLHVLVGSPVRTRDPVSVEEPGALPAVAGGGMYLDVEFREPQFAYFVWIDATGRALPLYPWNSTKLEVTDIRADPPTRRAGKRVFSPLMGNRWMFGEQAGLETVLLLVRTAPLPESTNIGDLLGELPPPPAVRGRTELVILEVRDHAPTVTTVLAQDRGDAPAAEAADEPLRALLLRLSPHFDLVRAVRFAHAP